MKYRYIRMEMLKKNFSVSDKISFLFQNSKQKIDDFVKARSKVIKIPLAFSVGIKV